MSLKVSILVVAAFIGGNALPLEKNDVSTFFDHTASSARIIGGDTAGDAPHMVALVHGLFVRTFRCGASLITTRHVLTAAHCYDALVIDGNLIPTYRGVIGSSRWAAGGTEYTFSGHITHPDYDLSIVKYDIGILITSSDVTLSDKVALATISYDFIGAGVATTVTGWGDTTNNSTFADVLLRLNATVMDGATCVTEVAEKSVDLGLTIAVDPAIEICTFHSTGHGVCDGDSGSPLMRADLNQQIGVVSWGLICAGGTPDIFVRLSAFRSWIEESINLPLHT